MLKFSRHTAEVMQAMPKHIFWSIIDSSSLSATIYTRSRCCYTPNRRAWSLMVTCSRLSSSEVRF